MTSTVVLAKHGCLLLVTSAKLRESTHFQHCTSGAKLSLPQLLVTYVII